MGIRENSKIVLLADVGGTNTRVALASNAEVDRQTLKKFRNEEHSSLAEVLKAYISSRDIVPDAAVVAVAGPVRDGRGELTNLDWTFDEMSLAQETTISRVHILNDLQAQGHALGHLAPNAMRTLLKGRSAHHDKQSQLVIGVGTGFNAAPVHESASGRIVVPSECGHVTLPQDSEEGRALAKWLEATLGFASVEDALSGRGLEALYAWKSADENPEKTGHDIILAASEGTDPIASDTVRLFVDLLGRMCGNLALIHLPYGGIYLIGGMARAVVPFFDEYGFEAAFSDKGRFGELMAEFSIFVIDDDFAALNGCAVFLAK